MLKKFEQKNSERLFDLRILSIIQELFKLNNSDYVDQKQGENCKAIGLIYRKKDLKNFYEDTLVGCFCQCGTNHPVKNNGSQVSWEENYTGTEDFKKGENILGKIKTNNNYFLKLSKQIKLLGLTKEKTIIHHQMSFIIIDQDDEDK